jgi:hypothetical protein
MFTPVSKVGTPTGLLAFPSDYEDRSDAFIANTEKVT